MSATGSAYITTTQTRKERKEQTRRKILDAAKQVLITHGSTGFSMREVAKLAGIAQPSIYKHFANLSELFEALADEAKSLYIFPLQRTFFQLLLQADENSLKEIFDRMFSFAIEAAKSRSDLYRMIVAERAQPQSVFGKHMVSFFDELKLEWVNQILELISDEERESRKIYYTAFMDAIFAMLETYALSEQSDNPEYKQKAATMVASFTYGMIEEDFRSFLQRKESL